MKIKSLFFPLFLVLSTLFVQAQDTATVKTRSGAVKVDPSTIVVHPVVTPAAQQSTQSQVAAQDPGIVDYNNPDSFFSEGAIGALYAAVTSILAYLGGFLPGVRNIKSSFIRSGVIIFALTAAIATFRFGALTESFFSALIGLFLPNFAFSGVMYKVIENVLKLFKIQIPKPGTVTTQS